MITFLYFRAIIYILRLAVTSPTLVWWLYRYVVCSEW